MPASVLTVFIIFGILFIAGAVYLVIVSLRVKRLRDKLDEKGKK